MYSYIITIHKEYLIFYHLIQSYLFVRWFSFFLKELPIWFYLADEIFYQLIFDTIFPSGFKVAKFRYKHIVNNIDHVTNFEFSKFSCFVLTCWIILILVIINCRLYHLLLNFILFDKLIYNMWKIFLLLNFLVFLKFFSHFISSLPDTCSNLCCLYCILI